MEFSNRRSSKDILLRIVCYFEVIRLITEGQVLDIAREAIYTIIMCSAPVLVISLVVGLVVSIIQTVTSIQEQTLTFVPKIIAVFLGLMLFGAWILNKMTGFMTDLWSNFSVYLG